jgi:predicted small secreted protein
MKKINLALVATVALGALALSSCDTPTGQGAGIGAATGAIIGAAATGNVRGAAIGAGIGAGTGALIGASIEADQNGYYRGHPGSYYPYGHRTDTPGVLRSPYPPHALVNVSGIPHGALVGDPANGGRPFRKP